jgi:hypothetical protein
MAMARMPDFQTDIIREWDKIVHHGHHHPEPPSLAAQLDAAHARTQTPATQPVTVKAPNPKEAIMSLLDTITEDVRGDLTDGLDYLEQFVGRVKAAAPSIINTADTLGGSTVGKLVEAAAGAVLPADVETELVNIVKTYVSRFSTPVATTTAAAPQAPVEAPAPAAPVAQPVQ